MHVRTVSDACSGNVIAMGHVLKAPCACELDVPHDGAWTAGTTVRERSASTWSWLMRRAATQMCVEAIVGGFRLHSPAPKATAATRGFTKQTLGKLEDGPPIFFVESAALLAAASRAPAPSDAQARQDTSRAVRLLALR